MGFQIKTALASFVALSFVSVSSFMVAQENENSAPGPVTDEVEVSAATSVVQEPEASAVDVTFESTGENQAPGEVQSPSAEIQQDVDQQTSPNDVVVAPQEESAPAESGPAENASSVMQTPVEVAPAPLTASPLVTTGCCTQPAPVCCSSKRSRVVWRNPCRVRSRRCYRGFRWRSR